LAVVEYSVDEHVARVTLNDGENLINPVFLEALSNVLDEIEHQTETATLVVTSAHEKIFCNGIDLAWLGPVLINKDMGTAKKFFYQLNRVFKRLINYPLMTIAAINGHAFAGGAILCCAFDFRFMRTDRGYFCLPEVDLGMPFPPGMNALLAKAIPRQLLYKMALTGARLTAEACVAGEIVYQACHVDELMNAVMAFAKTMKKDRQVVAEMKKRLNHGITQALDVEDVPYIEAGRYHIALKE
jgi:enoyl-CoA hydratase/carnithine racemase